MVWLDALKGSVYHHRVKVFRHLIQNNPSCRKVSPCFLLYGKMRMSMAHLHPGDVHSLSASHSSDLICPPKCEALPLYIVERLSFNPPQLITDNH